MRTLPSSALISALLASAALAGTAAGCSDGGSGTEGGGAGTTTPATGGGGTGGTGGSSGGAGGVGGTQPQFASNREMFEQTVQPGLDQKCAVCHQNEGFADFLALPDEYASITVYKSGLSDRPLIWPEPEESILYAYPNSPDHTGTNYGPEDAELEAAVLAWLAKEAESLPPIEDGPVLSVVPFKPVIGALNATYLNPLGEAFVGSAFSYLATEIGDPPSILHLSKLEVYPAAGVALHIVHPRFIVYPGDSTVGIPEPADSLAEVDHTFIQQEDPKLSSGELFITNWEPGARLSIDFSAGKIESYYLGSDGEIKVPCKDPDAFVAAVVALGDGGPMFCAETCHGGKTPAAKAAMNLSGLLEAPPNYDAACAFVRARITPRRRRGEPDRDGDQPCAAAAAGQSHVQVHGQHERPRRFKAAMTSWIESE